MAKKVRYEVRNLKETEIYICATKKGAEKLADELTEKTGKDYIAFTVPEKGCKALFFL